MAEVRQMKQFPITVQQHFNVNHITCIKELGEMKNQCDYKVILGGSKIRIWF